MSLLDERLDAAVQDLQSELDELEAPDFKPRRSPLPVVLALVALLGLGAVGYLVGTRPGDGGISVATQAELSEGAIESQTRQITQAANGEFVMPIPGAPAWSRNEQWVLLYRTGQAPAGHVVVDVAKGTVVELAFTPPDIEQIYWHPGFDDRLVYVVGNELFGFDVLAQATTMIHRFAGCDSVDSGVLPVPPASDGTLSLLCRAGSETVQVVLNLNDGQELRALTESDTAAFPTPTGNRLVRTNTDGSASVLNRDLDETGVVLDLAYNSFTFVTDAQGVEWVAASLFDGPAVGTVVLLSLDATTESVVVIGPERGDPYPPPGNAISGTAGRLAVSALGPVDGPIAGQVTVLDLAASLADPPRLAFAHGSLARHDYWSNPFVSLSPSGRSVLYASDQGTGSVNTFLTTISWPNE